MSKHTPGPWEIVKVSDGRLRITDCNPHEGDLVVELLRLHNITTQNTETELANARLIAAAPELLEACKLLATFVPPWAESAPPGLDPTMYGTGTQKGDLAIVGKVAKARAAIAKAVPNE